MIELPTDCLVDGRRGLVNRRIFTDPAILQREQELIFDRCWLFLGPESAVPLQTSMGSRPVEVRRDSAGRLRAWSASGEVARVRSYHGLVFGCRDTGAGPLEEHLGELAWWLDQFLLLPSGAGVTALPGCQRYLVPGNWKLIADNFTGDGLHVPVTHASAARVGVAGGAHLPSEHGYFMASLAPAHGLGWLMTDDSAYQEDLARARDLGDEVVDYVRRRQALVQRNLAGLATRPAGGWVFGNCFPNFHMQGMNSALRGHIVALSHPRSPELSEVQQWVLVDRSAPAAVRRLAARGASRGQSAAGLIGADDSENFERISESLRDNARGGLSFHYAMDAAVEGAWPNRERWRVDGLPGVFGPEFWETGQRAFYRHWASLMGFADDLPG